MKAPTEAMLADNGALKKALDEYMGTETYTVAKDTATFANVVLKSSKWNPAEPFATAKVSSTGAVSVSYNPDTLAK